MYVDYYNLHKPEEYTLCFLQSLMQRRTGGFVTFPANEKSLSFRTLAMKVIHAVGVGLNRLEEKEPLTLFPGEKKHGYDKDIYIRDQIQMTNALGRCLAFSLPR